MGKKVTNNGMTKTKIADHNRSNCNARSITKGKMKKVDTPADHNELKRSTQLKEVDKGMIAAACNLAKCSGTVTKTNFEAHHEWKRRVSESSKMTMTDVAHHEWKHGV